MAKRRPDPAVARGEALLAEWGLATDSGAEVLATVVGRDSAADLAIADRLATIGGAAAVALLQRLESDSGDRGVRKEAKRALYRLEQRGEAVQHAAPAPAAAPILGPELEGFVSPFDGRGDQLAWILKPRAGALLHFFALFNDPAGLREVSISPITRKSLREIRTELEQRHDLRLVAIDWRYVDFVVHRAHQWTRERGGHVEGDYLAIRAQLTQTPVPEAMEHPVWKMLAGGDDAPLASSAEVVGEPELRTWFPDLAALAPFFTEIDNIRDSPLVLNEAQQRERFDAVVNEATERCYAAAGRASWRRRVEAMAYVFAVSKRDEQARRCAAVAQALDRDVAFADIPLLAFLVRLAFDAHLQHSAKAEAERQESSLLVTPEQVRKRTRS